MRQIIYVSDIDQAAITSDAVTEILNASLNNNPALDVTGLLLFDYHHFLQVLEGPDVAVQRLYTTIANDTRHHHVKVISDKPIQQRDFAKWSMGFRQPSNPLSESVNLDSPNAEDVLILLRQESTRIE